MSRYSLAITASIMMSIIGGVPLASADPTPPIMPKVEETPIPKPVTIPAPETVPAEVQNKPLTASEAAQIALHCQPSVTVATAGVEASQGRVQQAKSDLLPNATITAGYTNVALTAGGITNIPDAYAATASVRQLIFDFNRTRNQVRQSQALERSSQANLTRVQSDLVYQVKQAYYTYTQNLRLVEVNESNLKNRQDHLALTKARVEAGIGLPSDVVRAETAVSEAVFSLNQAQNLASISRVNLATLMGLDPRTPIQVSEDQEPGPASDDVNALVQTALCRRPEIAQAQAVLQASQYGVNVAKTTNSPALVGTVGYTSRGDAFPPDKSQVAVGLALQWPVFDAGFTAGRVKEARANVVASQAQLESAKLTVTSDVTQAYLNEKTAEQRVATANVEVANAQESLRLTQGRYAAGLGAFIDVLDAQAALVTAQTNRVNAQSAVNQAKAALARAINCDPVFGNTPASAQPK